MLSIVVVFICLFGVTVCELVFDICIPPQWEGEQTLLTGTLLDGNPTFIQTTGHVSFDANHTKIAYYSSGTSNGKAFQRDYLFIYGKKLVYILEGEICHAEKLQEDFAPLCLPHDFDWTMSRTWYGSEIMDDQMWIFGYEGKKNQLEYSIQKNLEIGIVAIQQIRGSLYNAPFLQTTQLVNTTRGIHDMKVFDVPNACDNASVTGYFKIPPSIYGLFLP